MRTLRLSSFAVCALLVLFPKDALAEKLTITRGVALEVRFTIQLPLKTFTDRGPNEHGLFYPDMIYFDLSPVAIHGRVGEHSAYLYDGDTLLGVVTNDVVGNSFIEMGTFMSADSLFFAGPARQTVVDMSSVLDGTIDGRLVFTIARGAIIVDETDIRAMLGLGYFSTFGIGDALNIVSLQAVPIQ